MISVLILLAFSTFSTTSLQEVLKNKYELANIDISYHLFGKVAVLEHKNKNLEAKVKELFEENAVQERMNTALGERIKELEKKIEAKPEILTWTKTAPAFLATFYKDVSPSKSSVIVFDKTTMNLNNAYNTGNGVFTTPIAGRYIFALSVRGIDGRAASAAIYKNKVQTVLTVAASSGWGGSSSVSTILDLQPGDKVYVKEFWAKSHYQGAACFFSGALLYPL